MCVNVVNTVDDQINEDQINGQKGYDDYLYVVNSGFLTNYLTDLTFEGFYNNKLVILPLEKIKIRKQHHTMNKGFIQWQMIAMKCDLCQVLYW